MRGSDILDLVLFYFKSSGTQLYLCPMFGLILSPAQIWLVVCLEAPFIVLGNEKNENYKAKWPDKDRTEETNRSMVQKEGSDQS